MARLKPLAYIVNSRSPHTVKLSRYSIEVWIWRAGFRTPALLQRADGRPRVFRSIASAEQAARRAGYEVANPQR